MRLLVACSVASSHVCLTWVCGVLILPRSSGGDQWTCKVMKARPCNLVVGRVDV